jgi:predicted ATPase/DNA-binding SARP family transcriptional activator
MNGERALPVGRVESEGLCLFLLGACQIKRLDSPVRLPTRKTQSLLAYLALHPWEHSREKLAALFWGDSTDEEARHSLRMALSTLRGQLGDDLLLADRETVQLNPANGAWVDAVEFEARATHVLAQSPPDPGAVDLDLYQGDLLPDFYDDWVIDQRERYRQLYVDLLLHLAQHWRTQGEYRRVIDLANRVLTLDRANEAAHRHLMFAFFTLRDRNAALKQYEACVFSLRDELAVDPSPETLALYTHIKTAPLPGAALSQHTNNLPVPLSSFIGREREIAELRRLLLPAEGELDRPRTRLLTVTGPGGAGKTRLAIQVASELADSYRDGVWWVDLTPLTEDERVIETVAKTLGVVALESQALEERLLAYLRQKRVLLVWDNCEHRIAACARLAATLLAHSPYLQILATSREAMDVPGETMWLAPSLSLPESDAALDAAGLLEYESIRLFVERASAVRGDFRLAGDNGQAVVRICHALDGMPLAIELAAARAKAMSVAQIADRLGYRLDLLTVGNRAAAPRHQTLRAAIEWSYDLLGDAERALFRRLAVFTGGWTLEASEAVCLGQGIAAGQVLHLLALLVDKSLVKLRVQDGEARYRLLETIREYACEKLEAAGEVEEVSRRHCQYFAQFAERARPHLRRASQMEWLRRLDADYDNLRAAIEWALRQNLEPDVTAGLRTAVGIATYWLIRALYLEGCDYLIDLLQATDLAPMPLRAWALYGVGELALYRSDYHLSRRNLEQSIAMFETLSDPGGAAYPKVYRSYWYFVDGETDLAFSLWNDCAKQFRSVGDAWGLAWALSFMGRGARESGDFEGNRVYNQEAAVLLRAIGDRFALSTVVSHLGLSDYRQHNYRAARAQFDYRIAVARELNARVSACVAGIWVGYTELGEENYDEAAARFKDAIRQARPAGLDLRLLQCFEGLALVAARRPAAKPAEWRQALEQATRLWAARQAFIDAWQTPLLQELEVDEEHEITALRAQLGDPGFAMAWSEGSNMQLDQVIQEALSV